MQLAIFFASLVFAVPQAQAQAIQSPITIVDVPIVAMATPDTQLISPLPRICSCESTGAPDNTPVQFNQDGSVLHGEKHPPDTGACQINADVWGAQAQTLGYDINTRNGNYAMANYILETAGQSQWSASKACWQ